jgi:hypothetical protein
MKNVHVIPTDKPSRLLYFGTSKELTLLINPATFRAFERSPQNIYITSDEEIKEGDWFIRDGSIHKCFRVHKTDIEFLTSIDSVYCGSNTFWSKEFCKKIILTTDTDLIKDGVQSIDDDFIEWFVRNPSCEEVETVFACRGFNGTIPNLITIGEYKIIIPKEEQKQHLIDIMRGDEELGLYEELQETLEEAAENYAHNYFNMHETNNYKALKAGFEKGAKWQQEKMYSEEDMIAFYNFIENHQLRKFGDVWKRITNNPNDKPLNFESVDDNYIIEWFEQFKKK